MPVGLIVQALLGSFGRGFGPGNGGGKLRPDAGQLGAGCVAVGGDVGQLASELLDAAFRPGGGLLRSFGPGRLLGRCCLGCLGAGRYGVAVGGDIGQLLTGRGQVAAELGAP
jgi:hypothetical protein